MFVIPCIAFYEHMTSNKIFLKFFDENKFMISLEIAEMLQCGLDQNSIYLQCSY